MLKGIITFINIQIEQHFLHNRNNDPVLSKQFALFLADISGRKSANFSCLKRKVCTTEISTPHFSGVDI